MAWVPLALSVLSIGVAFGLRQTRWANAALLTSRLAYVVLLLQAPLYFMVRGGVQLSSARCEWTFGPALAIYSLTNYPHIVLFTVFFLVTYTQFRGVRRPIIWSAVATIAVGLLVELAQAVSGQHHCRMRDLIPDSVGVMAGAVIVSASRKLQQNRPASGT